MILLSSGPQGIALFSDDDGKQAVKQSKRQSTDRDRDADEGMDKTRREHGGTNTG